jgi:hypothetical protein
LWYLRFSWLCEFKLWCELLRCVVFWLHITEIQLWKLGRSVSYETLVAYATRRLHGPTTQMAAVFSILFYFIFLCFFRSLFYSYVCCFLNFLYFSPFCVVSYNKFSLYFIFRI